MYACLVRLVSRIGSADCFSLLPGGFKLRVNWIQLVQPPTLAAASESRESSARSPAAWKNCDFCARLKLLSSAAASACSSAALSAAAAAFFAASV
jgi:hypothetical protein